MFKIGGVEVTPVGEYARSAELVARLASVPVSTARIESVSTALDHVIVRLGVDGGRYVDVTLPVVPDRTGAARVVAMVDQPLAVLLRRRTTRLDCSLLGTSVAGPKRVVVGVAAALALCQAGVHGVLRCDGAIAPRCDEIGASSRSA